MPFAEEVLTVNDLFDYKTGQNTRSKKHQQEHMHILCKSIT